MSPMTRFTLVMLAVGVWGLGFLHGYWCSTMDKVRDMRDGK